VILTGSSSRLKTPGYLVICEETALFWLSTLTKTTKTRHFAYLQYNRKNPRRSRGFRSLAIIVHNWPVNLFWSGYDSAGLGAHYLLHNHLYMTAWGNPGICYLGDKPHSPNLSDFAECVILCTSWLQSPGKVYCRAVNI
jgi:hypothetical protein